MKWTRRSTNASVFGFAVVLLGWLYGFHDWERARAVNVVIMEGLRSGWPAVRVTNVERRGETWVVDAERRPSLAHCYATVYVSRSGDITKVEGYN